MIEVMLVVIACLIGMQGMELARIANALEKKNKGE